jgi:hypothetical protein
MRALALMVLAATAVVVTPLLTTESYAQSRREWKWCLHGGGIRSCTFPTFEQCNKGRRARGGHCERNPRYVGR